MKKVVLLLIFTGLIISSKAQYQINFIDSLVIDSSAQYTPIESINLTGNYTELVVAVGFPDRPNTQGIPQLIDNPEYPVLGTFEDGTLLQDYIATIHFNSNLVDEIKHFPSLIS